MADGGDTRLVSEEHLDLSMIAPANRRITLPVGQPRTNQEFLIRGRLDTDRMIRYLQLETQLNEALADEVDAAGAKLVAALEAANEEIRDLLLDLNPPEKVPPKLGLDEQQTLITLAWISGDISVADAIAHALTAGVSGAKSAEELDGDAAVAAGADGADAAAPFSSSNSS